MFAKALSCFYFSNSDQSLLDSPQLDTSFDMKTHWTLFDGVWIFGWVYSLFMFSAIYWHINVLSPFCVKDPLAANRQIMWRQITLPGGWLGCSHMWITNKTFPLWFPSFCKGLQWWLKVEAWWHKSLAGTLQLAFCKLVLAVLDVSFSGSSYSS